MTPTLLTLPPDLLKPPAASATASRRDEPARPFSDLLRGVQDQSRDLPAREVHRPEPASDAPPGPDDDAARSLDDDAAAAAGRPPVAESDDQTPVASDVSDSPPPSEEPAEPTEQPATAAPASVGAESAAPAQTVHAAAQVLPFTTPAPAHAGASNPEIVTPAGSSAAAPIEPTPAVGVQGTQVTSQVVPIEAGASSGASAAPRVVASETAPAPPPSAPSSQGPVQSQGSGVTGPAIVTRDDGQSAPQQQQQQDAGTRDGQRHSTAARVPSVATSAPVTPAVGRAAEVDASVRLENATGQPATLAAGRAAPIDVLMSNQAPGHAATPALAANGAASQASTGGAGMLDEEAFGSRVVRGLTTVVNQRGGVMTMRLQPPDLGDLRVQMTLTRGLVSAQFHASTPEAHGLLEKSMAMLRTALENQGLTVQRLSVHLSPGAHAGADHGGQSSTDQQQQGSRQDAAGEQSRGRRDGHPAHARGRDEVPRGFEDHISDRAEPAPSVAAAHTTGGPIR